MKRLACFGSCCIDYYTSLDTPAAFAGGGPLNTAVHCTRLGLPSSLISCAGDDSYGTLIHNALKDNYVDDSHFHIRKGSTAFCETALEGIERILGDYEEGVMRDFHLDDRDIRFLHDHDILLTDLWGNQSHVYQDPLLSKQIKVFDAADRPDDPAALAVIPYTDILFFSADGPPDAVLQKMLSLAEICPGMIIATRGSGGSVCLHQGTFTSMGIVHAPIIKDTMGAGDSFIAGFLYAYAQNRTVRECLAQGALCASEVLSYYGAFYQEGKSDV